MIKPIGIFSIILFVLIGCSSKKQQGPNEIPPVILIDRDGKQISAQSLPGSAILIFFSSGCDHCQREAAQIHNELEKFERYTLYFVSMDSFEDMDRFAKEYGLDDRANIKFKRADASTVTSSLGNIETPTILVFSGEKVLLHRFNGETEISEILKIL